MTQKPFQTPQIEPLKPEMPVVLMGTMGLSFHERDYD
jgi:hypothetical protein